MKKIMFLTTILAIMLFQASCNKKNDTNDPGSVQEGVVKGIVLDTKGQPMKDVEVVIDNTLVWNSNLVTKTDANGRYSVKLGISTWKATANHYVDFDGKRYRIPLHPDDASGFTQNGAIRNFQWKLTGKQPGTDLDYGGFFNVEKEVGNYNLMDIHNIEFTLTPVGKLIDGSDGQVIKMKPGAPGTDNANKLTDIPLGKYRITASYPGKTILVRNYRDQSAQFASSTTISFDPMSTWGPNSGAIEFSSN